MALYLIPRLTDEETARHVQLAIQYDPHPPLGGIDYNRLLPLMKLMRSFRAFKPQSIPVSQSN